MKVAAPRGLLVQDSSSKVHYIDHIIQVYQSKFHTDLQGRVDGNSSKSSSLPLSPSCDCSMCKDVLRNTAHLTCSKPDKCFKLQLNVRLGDRVIVRGRYTGVVRYVGDLDSSYNNDQIYVGVKTDDPG